ncbi:MAG: hypothetical protein ACOZIN_06700 [Myxococcota bacterium]
MAEKTWGHCKHCRYFASHSKVPLSNEEARCLQPVLGKFDLRVFGASGCNGFELREGLPSSVEQPAQA